MKPLRISYRFHAKDGTDALFTLDLDPLTLQLPDPEEDQPEWTRLEFRRCPHCPLDVRERSHCPVAAQLPRLIKTFNHLVSHDRVQVEVTTEERTVTKEASVQAGMGALMGLIMAVSGCPIMTFFRPMARFHLPFATQDETIFRAASTYLLADYFRTRSAGTDPDLGLAGLTEIYRQVHILNSAFFDRIKAAARTDASLNALVHLDMFALMLPLQAERELPAVLEYFRPFLEGVSGKPPPQTEPESG